MTPLSRVKQYRTARAALVPVFRQISKGTFNKNTDTKHRFLKSYHQEKKRHLCRVVRVSAARLQPASVKAKLAVFRALILQKVQVYKNVIQASRAATLAVRSERTRLVGARYYRTRAKLRLPNQRVKRQDRKREGLRLFARHTLKRPKTTAGRGKLLLPTSVYRVSS